MIPAAHVAHALPRRLRLRVPERRNEAAYFAALEEQLGGCAGVTAVVTNPRTAGVLIHHHETLELEALARCAAEHGAFSLAGYDAASPTLLGRARRGLDSLDLRLLDESRGTTDTRTLVLVLLLLLALFQMARGQVLVSAASLLWYAFELVREPPRDADR